MRPLVAPKFETLDQAAAAGQRAAAANRCIADTAVDVADRASALVRQIEADHGTTAAVRAANIIALNFIDELSKALPETVEVRAGWQARRLR